MKTNSKTIYFTISLILFGIISCDDFLEEDPRNFINPDSFYQTQSDADAGLASIYFQMSNDLLSRATHAINHHSSDYTWPWAFTGGDVGYNYNPDFALSRHLWTQLYEGVKRANSFIGVLENREVDFDSQVKARMLGEAKFLRAYYYYTLVQFWGDIPLLKNVVSSEDDYYQPAAPASEIWEFIKSDLLDAINSLPSKSSYSGADVSRANKEAAKSLMAKYFMIHNDWPNAKIYVDEIIASEEYELEEDIVNNWRTSNEHGKESIFEVVFGSGFAPRLGNSLFQLSGPSQLRHPITDRIITQTWTGVAFSPFFYNSFDDEDMRKQRLFFDPSTHAGPVGRYFTNKYFDPNVMTNAADGSVNWVVLRYADVLLMKAEIENEINSGPNTAAYDAINMVRNRANIEDLPDGLSYEEFSLSVFEERRKELFFEAHCFFDIKRRGYNFTKQRVETARFILFEYVEWSGEFDVKETEMVLPFPQVEVDANPKLEQKPGY